MATELEDLDQLIRSQGWLRLKQWVSDAQIFAALGDRENEIAVDKARQVAAASKAVERVLLWPSERLSQLAQAVEMREKDALVPMSRRGSL